MFAPLMFSPCAVLAPFPRVPIVAPIVSNSDGPYRVNRTGTSTFYEQKFVKYFFEELGWANLR